MTKIKICGMTRECDIAAANIAEPDYIGFVFAQSKRKISYEQAELLKSLTDIQTVGVFVNETVENVVKACKIGIIDIIQLHGEEDNEYIKKIKEQTQAPIIKAIRIKDKNDIDNAVEYNSDFLLFDTYNNKNYGGTGEAFDWAMLEQFEQAYFLAGGIHADNIERALKITNPFAVDVSSGVETNGLKDSVKIEKIVNLVRRANNA